MTVYNGPQPPDANSNLIPMMQDSHGYEAAVKALESLQAASLAASRRLVLVATAEAFSTAQTPPILPSVAKSDEMVTMFSV